MPKGCRFSFWKRTEGMHRRVCLGQVHGDFRFPRVVRLGRTCQRMRLFSKKGCSDLESETEDMYCVLHVFRGKEKMHPCIEVVPFPRCDNMHAHNINISQATSLGRS